MIIKNGEILAIDHIAHDNTLSGNGTSAKPVGLSQSTTALIDSKVKQSEFDTYKSSVANQIRDINNTIAVDESNLESYKETVAASFTTVNDRITDVANAKQDKGNYVSATNFNDFKNTVEGQIEALETGKQPVGDYVVTNDFNSYKETVDGKFTTVNERITNVANAKQDKGDYVSASDFNTYKTDVAGEIARVDGRIDTTNTNLENNYYKKNQTYSQSEVDEIVSKLGAYVYVENVTSEGYPIVDEPSTKVIYLTQIPNETQCLQWIWLETQEWKCIGDTTMNLSAYATKEWTNNNFETIDQFNTTIANYYTKGEVNAELATKVDNNDFNAYKTEVNGKFATKQSLTDTKAELENDIDSASAEIISKVNTDYGTLNDKIDDIATTLSNDYYTSLEIDAILAASGEYYTKTESDTKYAEKEVFNTAINELSSNKLDKSATANWDVTEYTEGENIKIVGHEISGKDWSNEIADAVENKVDESELENYYTSNQIDNKFVTNDEFNILDNDLDTLSGKTISVIKDSETVKAIRSTEPDGTISYTLSAHDGKQADYLWKPTVNAAGDISWELALTGDTPVTANIKGSDGDDGKTPVLSANGTHIEWKYTDESIWNDLGDFKGESGADGKDGKDGINGTSAFVRINPNTNYWEISNDNETWTSTDVSATGPQGEDGDEGEPGFSPTVDAVAITDGEKTGTEITFTYKDAQGQTQTTVYSAWNGVNGEGATVHFNGVDGIEITPLDTTHFNVGLSATYKKQVEDVSGKLDASDLVGYATEAWVEDKNYLIADDITGKADKTELETVSGEIVNKIPSLDGYATEQYVQGASAEVTAWVNNQGYLKSVPAGYATETWVNNQGFLTEIPNTYALKSDIPTTVAQLTDSANYYTINQTSAASELTTEFAKYALKANIPTKVTDLTDSANYYTINQTSAASELTTEFAKYTKTEDLNIPSKVTDLSDSANYVATADLLTAASNKLTGIKVGNTNYEIPLFGGVTTDTNTITGDGNTNPLGVAWSALSGYTITSALSANSASYAVALGTTASYSALSDIAGAINNAKFAGVSIADGSSITGNGLSTNKLGLVTSAENALTAVDNKLDKTAIVTATIDNTNYVTAVNINSTNIPIKGTSFWEVTAATGTTASNDTWQHYISTTNTFNYYKMVIHPYGTSSAQEWANDGIIHIILEA